MNKILSHIILFLLWLVALLPLRALYVLSDGIRFILFRVVGYRQQVVEDNLRRCFPEKDEAERKEIAGAFYTTLCDNIVETVKLLHISDSELRRRVKVAGVEHIEALAAQNRPIILFLGHFGNWEWVQEITSRYAHPAVNGELYKPAHNEMANRVMGKIRSRFASRNVAIPQSKAVRTLIAMRQQYGTFLIGFIADQRPPHTNTKHWMKFLGQDTPFVVGGEEIGNHIDAGYLYLDISRPCRGQYLFSVKSIGLSAEDADFPYTRGYMRMLEASICREPHLWLWSHKRWKNAPAATDNQAENQN